MWRGAEGVSPLDPENSEQGRPPQPPRGGLRAWK